MSLSSFSNFSITHFVYKSFYNYKKIIYSINKNDEFGTEVGDDVKRYILEQLYRVKLKYMLF